MTLLLEGLAITVTLFLILWICLLVRLNKGPIPLDFLADNIQKTIDSNLTHQAITFGSSQIVWNGYGTPIELQLNNVEIKDRDSNTPLLLISKIGLEVSKTALLTGSVRPKSLSFYDTAMRIYRTQEGKLSLRVQNQSSPSVETQVEKTNITDEAPLKKPQMNLQWADLADSILSDDKNAEDTYLSHLSTLRVINADLVLQDEATDQKFALKRTVIKLKKARESIIGTIEGNFVLGKVETPLISNFHYGHENGVTRFLTRFNDFDLENIDTLLPESLKADTILNGKVSGIVFLMLNEKMAPTRLRINATGNAGKIISKKLYNTTIEYDRLSLKSGYDFGRKSFAVEEFKINAGDMVVNTNLRHSYNANDNGYDITLNGEVTNVKIDELSVLWPEGLAKTPRSWVTNNLSSGDVELADINVRAKHTPNADKKKFNIENLNGRIIFKNADVKYLPDFPEITKVNGEATYTKDSFLIETTGGTYSGLNVQDAKILIDSFTPAPANIDIKINSETTVKTALQLIDQDPFKFPSKMKLPIDAISGTAKLSLGFNFPLLKSPPSDKIKLSVDGELSNIEWKSILLGKDLKDATLKIKVNQNEMTLNGKGTLDGNPVDINWLSDFKGTRGYLGRLLADATVKRDTLSPYLPAEDVLIEGEVPLNVEYIQYKSGTQTAKVKASLKSASYLIPILDLQKPISAEGHAEFDLLFQNGTPTKVQNMVFATPELAFFGDMDLVTQQGITSWSKGQFSKLRFKKNELNLEIERKNKNYEIKLSGPTLDISHLMKKNRIEYGQDNPDLHNEEKNQPTFTVSGHVDKVITAADHPILSAKLFLVRGEKGHIRHFELDGMTGGGQLYLRYKPDNAGNSTLMLEADNAGAALSSLNITNSIKGGTLIVHGTPLDKGGPRELQGKIQLSNFTIVRAPVLARLLGSMSLGGMQELLSGQGISFSRLKADFFWNENYNKNGKAIRKFLRIKEGRTSGSSLGLTFDGTLDYLANTIDSKGTIVPVSGISKAVGGIPLIGDLLTGGGGGVFAATYTIKGPSKQPTVTVNPLAALAPGILRTIFFEGN